MRDQRDSTTWVVLELTPIGEKLVEEGTLAVELRRLLGVEETWPVFVPSRSFEKKEKMVTIHLMEGYAFIATGLDEIHYFRLEQTKVVEQVLSQQTRGVRVLSTIPDSHINDLRRRLNQELASDIIPGMEVIVLEGTYAKLQGMVEDIEKDHAVVKFEFRSLKVFAKVPKVFLDTVA